MSATSSSGRDGVIFAVDPRLSGLQLETQSLRSGVELATKIIGSLRYAEILIANLADEVKPSNEAVRNAIYEQNITISFIEIGQHMDAYSLVYRVENPNQIFLNPLLLMQMRLSELNGTNVDLMRKYSLFVAVKMIHEFCHLIHPHISENLQMQIKMRTHGGGNKKRMVTPIKKKDGHHFSDYGDMVEYDLCGGIMEIYTSATQPKAFFIEELILFEFPLAPAGRIVQVKRTEYEFNDMRLNLSADIVEKQSRGQRGHLGVDTRFSVSGLGASGEQDVLDLNDEPDDGILVPRF